MSDPSDFEGWPDDEQIEKDLARDLGRRPEQHELEARMLLVYLRHTLSALLKVERKRLRDFF